MQIVVGTGTDGKNVEPNVLEATMGNQLRASGFDGAAIVMLGGPDGGETIGYWSRFCMSDDLGHWVGELVHQPNLSNLPDLWDYDQEYPGESMGTFDQESELYGATHFFGLDETAHQMARSFNCFALHLGGMAGLHPACSRPHSTAPSRKSDRRADRSAGALPYGRGTPASRPI